MSGEAFLLVAAVSWFVVVGGLIAVVLTVLTRRNRPVPSRRSAAPVWWLAAPSPSAFLHRRVVTLTRAVQRARAMRRRTGAPTVLDDLAARFEEHAVSLDDRIAAASTLPRKARRQELVAIHKRVRRAEEVATELSAAYLNEPLVPGDGHDALEQVADDLDALVQARRVVDDISRSAHPAGGGRLDGPG
ncbi:MAG: hypothetical protein R2754_03605 [Microthrixaceae bacterium]